MKYNYVNSGQLTLSYHIINYYHQFPKIEI